MGKYEETQEAYFGQGEKVIVERDRMCLAQALIILHSLRDMYSECEDIQQAFRAVFEFIDDMAILLQKIEGIYESKVNEASVAAAGCADQDDRSDT